MNPNSDATMGTPTAQTSPATVPDNSPAATANQTAQPQAGPQTAAQPAQQPTQQTAPALAPKVQPSAQPGTVSNTPAPDPHTQQAVQRANRVRLAAQALAGGPRFRTVVSDDGTMQRVQVPMSRADIGMAIAMEAISGALSGLAQQGPGAVGRAGAAGFEQVAQQQRQAQQQADEQAQLDATNKANALSRKSAIFEANSRARLNTSEAEAQGADAIDKLVSINRASGVLDVDPAVMDNGGVPMTQQELLDALKAGRLNVTDQLGPVAGRVEVTDPDGTKRWEATHLVIRDPNTPVQLNQQQWDRLAAADVPGFPKGSKIGNGIQIPLRVMQNANEIAASHYLAGQRLDDLRDVLDGTQYAGKVPTSIDFSKPGVNTAMQRFQTYVSHNADNLNDPLLALQQMGAAKRDPNTGQIQPNPDAKYVDTVAQQFGGWPVLQAAHDQMEANKKAAAEYAVIDTADKANAVLSAPKRFTQDQVQAARNFLTLSNQQGERKAVQDARARAVATGADVQAMYRFGKNPVTGEVLSLDNAPPSMLVDPSGNVIPQDMVSTYKPTAQERQTADTARQVLAISAGLQKELQQNPNLAGPLSGRSRAAIAKLGYSDQQTQRFLDDLTFLQSAATKMHTGRFSNEILKKMDSIVKPGMNAQQFTGALSSINDVASRYADEDQLRTVASYKRQLQTPMNPAPATGSQVQIPAGAQIGRDAQGNVVGYKLNGKYVPLGGNQ